MAEMVCNLVENSVFKQVFSRDVFIRQRLVPVNFVPTFPASEFRVTGKQHNFSAFFELDRKYDTQVVCQTIHSQRKIRRTLKPLVVDSTPRIFLL